MGRPKPCKPAASMCPAQHHPSTLYPSDSRNVGPNTPAVQTAAPRPRRTHEGRSTGCSAPVIHHPRAVNSTQTCSLVQSCTPHTFPTPQPTQACMQPQRLLFDNSELPVRIRQQLACWVPVTWHEQTDDKHQKQHRMNTHSRRLAAFAHPAPTASLILKAPLQCLARHTAVIVGATTLRPSLLCCRLQGPLR